MFGKNKKKNENVIDESKLNEDNEDKVIEGLDEDLDKKEIKEIEKKKKKEEENEIDEARDQILNSKPKTKVGKAFKMYQFIIKIIMAALLISISVAMLVQQDNIIAVVYLFSGILIAFSGLIRMIPLIKTSKCPQARLIVFIQCLIHVLLGGYLIGAAFYHWHELHVYLEKLSSNEASNTTDVFEKLKQAGDFGWGKFNIDYYAYFLVAFFATLAGGYFWVTIRYKEPTTNGLFRLQMFSFVMAVLLGCLGHLLDARTLIITLAIIALLSGVYTGVDAGGSYYRYRKSIAPKVSDRKEKKAEKNDGKRAPSRKEDIDYSDIDPTIIPEDDPRDSNIIN